MKGGLLMTTASAEAAEADRTRAEGRIWFLHMQKPQTAGMTMTARTTPAMSPASAAGEADVGGAG